ncbi:Myotubularin-related protein 13 [Eumeta japonica]|uniref:Myotubularin-related protein 13 n=1 Tax=Eumeta variegata TaxID=151549 RepID=A0A4C1X9Z8_EUMVA|nr:Myotubularin-related protein 13 [Eumeta japonica]
MNCALQSATALDEHNVAAAMLPLATAYCRKLCTGVIQYAYMCIQEHQIWSSQQFWEAAFYQDVQRDIKALYLPSPTHHIRAPSPREDSEYISLLKAQEPSALEIAAEQMRLWPNIDLEKQRELAASEESTLYSQAIHYANRMVYLLLPLEGAGRRADPRDEADRASNSITNSVAESDSADAESGFEEADPGEAGNNVIKMVSRFVDKSKVKRAGDLILTAALGHSKPQRGHQHVAGLLGGNSISNGVELSRWQTRVESGPPELSFIRRKATVEAATIHPYLCKCDISLVERAHFCVTARTVHRDSDKICKSKNLPLSALFCKVCTEGGVTADHVRCLHQMVPGVVHMHLEALDAVARESRRLPPVQKPRIVSPTLLSGESVAAPALRAFLVADGRESPLLPAEGALFLTNYRLIFKGTPTDPFACEQTVVRSFPLCSLTREKQIRTHYLPHLDQSLQEGLQLRSSTFQLIKVALDEEVSSEQTEAFRKQVGRLRHPTHPLTHFAFAGRPAHTPRPPDPDKHSTLKGFAKKTLLKTARRAGLKPKPSKRQKYVLPSAGARSLTSPPLMSSLSADTLSLEELETASVEVEGACVSDARTLERLKERAYARDWQRCGLAAPPFRLSHSNAIYSVCRSYPALMPVPDCIGDESLRRVARAYRQGRLPLLTWRHPRTGALLARLSSWFSGWRFGWFSYGEQDRPGASHHKGVMGMLKATSHQTQVATQSGTEPTSSLEQERYLSVLASCTPAARGELADSSLSLDSLLLGADEPPSTHTPLLTKAAGTLSVLGRNSGGKGNVASGAASGGARHFGRWGSLKDRRQNSHLELYAPRQRLSTADLDSVSGEGSGWVSGGTAGIRRAALYVMSEKGTASATGCEHVPVEYPDTRAAKHAFKKLMRACVPSAPPAHDEPGFLKLVEESGWLWQLRQLFQLSGAVVDLLDLQGSSVLVSLEDGWDATAQISSLAQLCLEPYYRTIEGFRVLIEKEWLALGHKFQQRSNIAATPQQGFTPTFLQFLDAVHQLQKQFPLAFEFNDYYLRFVAYHTVSCRFRTFLFDNEAQRAELGVTAADDRRTDTLRLGVETGAGSEDESGHGGGGGGGGGASPRGPALGQSVFDYIEKQHQRAPIFYNFLYTPDLDNPVLRPVSMVCCMEVWEYYVSEELCGGAPYDPELAAAEPRHYDHRDPRTIVANGYDSIGRCMPDAFSGLLERARQLELELGHLPQKWRVRWEQLELPNTLDLQRNSSMSSALVRRAGRSFHKRSTLEVLVRGRLAAAPAPSALPSHRFQATGHAAPAHCDHCAGLLWGPVKTGVRCMDCGAVCHERCAEAFALPCTKYKAPPATEREPHHAPPQPSGVSTLQASSQQYYEQFSSNVAENRTHEGHLYKRGALLKGWKQRWFVLDSIKHQLRYYDAVEDSHCKGFIDLAEVIAVSPAAPAPGPPKKCDDRSFFDLFKLQTPTKYSASFTLIQSFARRSGTSDVCCSVTFRYHASTAYESAYLQLLRERRDRSPGVDRETTSLPAVGDMFTRIKEIAKWV